MGIKIIKNETKNFIFETRMKQKNYFGNKKETKKIIIESKKKQKKLSWKQK